MYLRWMLVHLVDARLLGRCRPGLISVCAYAALSILKIRTFLEHQAHERARGRTVIIEDRGPLAWMFLNNNLHVVHHMHPKMPWYRLPELFRSNRERYLSRNDGYIFAPMGRCFGGFSGGAKIRWPIPMAKRDALKSGLP